MAKAAVAKQAHKQERRVTINRSDAFRIGRMIEQFCEVKNGSVQYNDGWSDAAIAEKIKATYEDATPELIARLRKQLLGPLVGESGSLKSKLDDAHRRIDAMSKLVRELREVCATSGKQILELTSKVDHLQRSVRGLEDELGGPPQHSGATVTHRPNGARG